MNITIKNITRTKSIVYTVFTTTVFALFYALIEQAALPVPLSPVPVILQPLPLFFLSFTVGLPAALGFAMYIIQGALGAPIFAFGLSGIARLMGPTGGYLIGMLIASFFISFFKDYAQKNYATLCVTLFFANAIVYSCGLTQLSFFVSTERLLAAGFFPFMPGLVVKNAMLFGFFRIKKQA